MVNGQLMKGLTNSLETQRRKNLYQGQKEEVSTGSTVCPFCGNDESNQHTMVECPHPELETQRERTRQKLGHAITRLTDDADILLINRSLHSGDLSLNFLQ